MTDRMTFKEGATLLGVSRPTFNALVRRHKVRVYKDPLDSRKKLVERKALAKIKEAGQ